MKKSPPTPDVNEKAPRPRRLSSDVDDVPTMDSPPHAPSESATGYDQATDAMEQKRRAGLLPGSDDRLAPEDPSETPDDIDMAEGVDPDQYRALWGERQSFPQQNDPDQEGLWENEEPDDLPIKSVHQDEDDLDVTDDTAGGVDDSSDQPDRHDGSRFTNKNRKP